MLLTAPFYFANQVDNLTGTPPAATVGTNFTANANNADGSVVAVLSALSFDVHYLIVGIGGINTSTANCQCLLDVVRDPAGGTAWVSFIDDLVCGFTPVPAAGDAGIQLWYHFPIYIRTGSSIGVRARTAHTSNISTGRVVMYAYGNPNHPDMWWCGNSVESVGINAASSSGTSVTPGNSGAFGSWTSVGSATTNPFGAIQFGLNGSDSSSLAIGYYWQIGYGSTQLPGSPVFYASSTTAEVTARSGFGQIIWCDIPAGTQLQARGTSSGTGEAYNMAFYGVY